MEESSWTVQPYPIYLICIIGAPYTEAQIQISADQYGFP